MNKTKPNAKELVLGCAQMGMNYGISNVTGVPDFDVVCKIMDYVSGGTSLRIDTAHSYLNSELILGRYQRCHPDVALVVGTKACLRSSPMEFNKTESMNRFRLEISESRARLSPCQIDTLILHRLSDISLSDGDVWRFLQDELNTGRVNRIGVSVQSPIELIEALQLPEIGYIQLPFNILDHRWHSCVPTIVEKKFKSDLLIDARSVFLQGLVFQPGHSTAWSRANQHSGEYICKWLDDTKAKLGIQDTDMLCLGYVQFQDWIDGIVIGVETLEQAERNTLIFNQFQERRVDFSDISQIILGEETLDPSKWLHLREVN